MKEGTLVYYLDEGQIHDGHVIDVETKPNKTVSCSALTAMENAVVSAVLILHRSTTRCLRMLRKRKST